MHLVVWYNHTYIHFKSRVRIVEKVNDAFDMSAGWLGVPGHCPPRSIRKATLVKLAAETALQKHIPHECDMIREQCQVMFDYAP